MSVISFINSIEDKTGKTMSMVAIATNMAIENNRKILLISTADEEQKLKSCYFEDSPVKKMKLGIFGENRLSVDAESGIEGITKMARSNKLTPEMIKNYTKVVFKDRLEIILGVKRKEDLVDEIQETYLNLINIASMYYDEIFVDLDNNLKEDVKNRIIEKSDLVIVHTSQNYSSIKKLKEYKEKSELLKSPKSLILIGRYDKFSKYNVKNITRYLEEKNQVLTVPYNTLFFEAVDEAGVPDLLLNFRKLSDNEDRNYIFIQEVKRATENIIYRLQELKMRR